MANVVKLLRFPSHLKELRIHLCQKSAASKGVRDFVELHYVDLKKNNPKFPILIRECSGVLPKLWARYEYGKENNVALTDMSSDQVSKVIEDVSNVK
ncbi:Uncharacterised protein g5897 [Pycnogonum litorale]